MVSSDDAHRGVSFITVMVQDGLHYGYQCMAEQKQDHPLVANLYHKKALLATCNHKEGESAKQGCHNGQRDEVQGCQLPRDKAREQFCS